MNGYYEKWLEEFGYETVRIQDVRWLLILTMAKTFDFLDKMNCAGFVFIGETVLTGLTKVRLLTPEEIVRKKCQSIEK